MEAFIRIGVIGLHYMKCVRDHTGDVKKIT